MRCSLETEYDRGPAARTVKTAEMPVATVTIDSPTEFRVENIPADKDQEFRNLLTDIELTYNRSSGAGGYTFTMRPNIAVQLSDESVTQALQTIERRVNELGVAEPIVARHSASGPDSGPAPRGRQTCVAPRRSSARPRSSN